MSGSVGYVLGHAKGGREASPDNGNNTTIDRRPGFLVGDGVAAIHLDSPVCRVENLKTSLAGELGEEITLLIQNAPLDANFTESPERIG